VAHEQANLDCVEIGSRWRRDGVRTAVVHSRAVAASEQTLEALVRDELRGPVSELVRQVVVELVREQLNGHAPAPVEATVTRTETTQESTNGSMSTSASADRKACVLCGETKPSSSFDPGRRQCRTCRTARYPKKRGARATTMPAAVDQEPPRTSPDEP
jgi:hypothetical protein